jgi:catalase-peroxidase
MMVSRAALLTLSIPEMTVLVGGMRALDANYDGSAFGILTDRPGQLTNDFFTNLLDASTVWSPVADTNGEKFEGKDLSTGSPKYKATRADLIFGSHAELRAVAEVYGSGDAQDKFVNDFARAWVKVMDLDRYDVR